MPAKLTTELFIQKARLVHGNEYDYSKVVYVNNSTKVIIGCKEHGNFEQTPNNHLQRHECKKCAIENKKSTNDKFIQKAIKIHGNLYDYSKVNYINAHTKVIIGCKEHDDFEQRPNDHLRGNGCPKCSESKKSSTKEFMKKSKLVHGNKYDYSKVNYINAHKKVIIICPIHGDFEQTPTNHLQRHGCNICPKENKKSTTEKFKSKAKEIHGDLYDYSKVDYINSYTKVIIGCLIHGDFEQKPNNHLNGQGCKKCNHNIPSTEKFKLKAKLVHGDKYDYSKVVYIGAREKVIIICKEHGDFEQIPGSHTNGNGCPICSKQGYSKKAITWLNKISNKENIHIQHAENEGEYLIPGTKYKADGFCKETNTIYEFYGDIWHGNLNLFEENELCHPFSNKSASDLYKKTKKREKKIKKLGYNLITIWENKFDNNV